MDTSGPWTNGAARLTIGTEPNRRWKSATSSAVTVPATGVADQIGVASLGCVQHTRPQRPGCAYVDVGGQEANRGASSSSHGWLFVTGEKPSPGSVLNL